MNKAKTKRRLALASRQLTMAKIARREAMVALADAVAHQDRAGTLAARSADLMKEYSRRTAREDSISNGAVLHNNTHFLTGLQEVARQAEKASQDASDQADWQIQNLAAADTRMNRSEERMTAAQRDLQVMRERSDQIVTGTMARKLQRKPKAAGGV